MYIELVRQAVETSVRDYAEDNHLTVVAVLKTIRQHLDNSFAEYYNNEPSIDYEDPLCRLAYLYRYAPAHANLFEHVLRNSTEISLRRFYANNWTLNICAVGGGPGTELLGIAKYLVSRPQLMPRKIAFTVLDSVPHWAELWQHLADLIETQLCSSLEETQVHPPIIAPSFLPLDVFNADSCRSYAYQFRRAHVVVFNYLFSENKTRLDEARLAIERLAELTPPGCAFVVIDRREHNQEFQESVVAVFESVFGDDIEIDTYDRALDSDEETSDMGEELIEHLLNPVTSFHTRVNREPTVFWLVAKRREEAS